MADKPVVTIVHELPGRLRLHLSHAPKDGLSMEKAIYGHAGINSVRYTELTRSLLIDFDHRIVRPQEILLRVALSLSLETEDAPIRILVEPETRGLNRSETLSAMMLFVALIARFYNGPRGFASKLEWVSGLSTARAITAHGWREIKDRGYFDPELWSLLYLLASFFRGNLLMASIFTWITSFGRHLVKRPPRGIVVRPLDLEGNSDGGPRREILVTPDVEESTDLKLTSFLPALLKIALVGDGAGPVGLIEEIRDVAHAHGEVLDGLGTAGTGIPVRFR